MNFYEILKTKKLGRGSPDYWTQLFAEHAGGKGEWAVAELTGMLPMTFRSNGTALIDYRIYGTTEGAGETKNLFKITAESQTINGVTFTVDKQAGTITANGTSSSMASLKQTFIATSEMAGNYYFSGSFNQTGSTSIFDAYMYDLTAKAFITKWDGTTRSPSIYGAESQEVKLIEGHNVELTLRIRNGTSVDNLVFKPMLRPANTTSDFIPHGYQIPLTISQQGQTDKSYNIYIGDSKLGEAEYVDYSEQKIYRRILFMMHDDKQFITKDNKDFCLRRRGYSG